MSGGFMPGKKFTRFYDKMVVIKAFFLILLGQIAPKT